MARENLTQLKEQLKEHSVDQTSSLADYSISRRGLLKEFAVAALAFASFDNQTQAAAYEAVPVVSFKVGSDIYKIDIRKPKDITEVKLFSHLTFLSMAYGLDLNTLFETKNGQFNFKVGNSAVNADSFCGNYKIETKDQAMVQLLASAIVSCVKKRSPSVNDMDWRMPTHEAREHFGFVASRLQELMRLLAEENSANGQRKSSLTVKKNIIIQLRNDCGKAFDGMSAVVEGISAMNFTSKDLKNSPFLANVLPSFIDFAIYNVSWNRMNAAFSSKGQNNQEVKSIIFDEKHDYILFGLASAYMSIFPGEKIPGLRVLMPKDKNELPIYSVQFKDKNVLIPLNYLLGLASDVKASELAKSSSFTKIEGMSDVESAVVSNIHHAMLAALEFKNSKSRTADRSAKSKGILIASDMSKFLDSHDVLSDSDKDPSGKKKPCISNLGWDGFY
jgi:hypothetical protein